MCREMVLVGWGHASFHASFIFLTFYLYVRVAFSSNFSIFVVMFLGLPRLWLNFLPSYGRVAFLEENKVRSEGERGGGGVPFY